MTKPRPPSPDCFFVEKAYHGQLAGAQAVLVTDHTEVSGAQLDVVLLLTAE